jgi:ribosomal protein L11 methylase PrmA
MKADEKNAGSFRDPSGFLFTRGGVLHRQVNQRYTQEYDRLMSGGLYAALTKDKLLVEHEEADPGLAQSAEAYKIIRPERIGFISYPYEWCFSQLKDAALLTLRIQRLALEHGMSLKDASAYNIQFAAGQPILIDTLSFETYSEGAPWVAYRQFCQHFLAPLALTSMTDVRLSQLMRIYIDGISMDLASALLPMRTRWRAGLMMHIHLHARSQARHAGDTAGVKGRRLSRMALTGLLNSLESTVLKLDWKPVGTEWGDYYSATNYTDEALKHKKELVRSFIGEARPGTVWDLGANLGLFSRLASEQGIPTVAFDIDPAAVEKNYRRVVADRETHLLPLVQDLTNPSAGIGWAGDERVSLTARGPADLVMGLALIHHLAISNNVPLDMVAEYMARLGRKLVIEFVPKEDSQVRRLLATREDVFPNYSQAGFEEAFAQWWTLDRKEAIPLTERTLYLMTRK